MRKMLFILMAALTACSVHAQSSKKDTLYFLVDTVNTPASSRIIEIGKEGTVKYYALFSKCIPNYTRYPVFTHPRNSSIITQKQIPAATIGLRQMLELLHTQGTGLSYKHVFVILEVLPDKRLLKSFVELYLPSDEVVN